MSEDAPGERDRFSRLSAGYPLERNPLLALVECDLELLEEPFPSDEHGYVGLRVKNDLDRDIERLVLMPLSYLHADVVLRSIDLATDPAAWTLVLGEVKAQLLADLQGKYRYVGPGIEDRDDVNDVRRADGRT